jgi:maltose O-acetyltransferase
MIKLFAKFFSKRFQLIRIYLFQNLSNYKIVEGSPQIKQPTLFVGSGKIIFKEKVQLGYYPSPMYFDTSIYIEARSKASTIIFEKNVIINNNAKIICDKTSIYIGENTIIGYNVEVLDSDFHGLSVENRKNGNYECKPVHIHKNVFIGKNVVILKGVTIGENSVIGNSTVVTKDVPPNAILVGNPGKIIRYIN